MATWQENWVSHYGQDNVFEKDNPKTNGYNNTTYEAEKHYMGNGSYCEEENKSSMDVRQTKHEILQLSGFSNRLEKVFSFRP